MEMKRLLARCCWRCQLQSRRAAAEQSIIGGEVGCSCYSNQCLGGLMLVPDYA